MRKVVIASAVGATAELVVDGVNGFLHAPRDVEALASIIERVLRQPASEWDIMRFAWSGDLNAANTFLDIFHSGSPQNLPGYQSAAFDRQLAEATAQADAHTAAELMRDAEQILINDYPLVPLYFYVSKHMVKPNIRGFEATSPNLRFVFT